MLNLGRAKTCIEQPGAHLTDSLATVYLNSLGTTRFNPRQSQGALPSSPLIHVHGTFLLRTPEGDAGVTNVFSLVIIRPQSLL